MVFARSRTLMARSDVSSHMVKWWKGQVSTKVMDGQITRSLSPYEQAAVTPWLKTFPKRAYDKFMDSAVYWLGAGAVTIGTVIWADKADAAQDFSHRY
mmetsp:Transcript_3302/g.3850  ORF Transcript_3302/g.3850 Transcript_3302/m.3850 type:complete len:98 (+) Transcript_3302:40-333(+)